MFDVFGLSVQGPAVAGDLERLRHCRLHHICLLCCVQNSAAATVIVLPVQIVGVSHWGHLFIFDMSSVDSMFDFFHKVYV